MQSCRTDDWGKIQHIDRADAATGIECATAG